MENKEILILILIGIISIYFVILFFNEIIDIKRDLSFCEDIKENDYQVPSCKICYNVTYDYSDICKEFEK